MSDENNEEIETLPESTANGHGIKSLSRVADYPVLKDSYSKASEYYNWIKSQNATLSSTLTWSENQLKVVINKVEPIAASKLHSVDEYACTKLDQLEQSYPIVKAPTEQVINSSQEFYNSNIKYRLVHASDSAVFIATTPYRVASDTLHYLSSTANNFVGRYLTPSTTSSGDQNEAIYSKAIKEIVLIKTYTLNNVANLQKLLQSVYEGNIKANEKWIEQCYKEYCDELTKKQTSEAGEPEQTEEADKTQEGQIKKLALSFTNKIRLSLRAMSTVCYNHLSEEKQKKMDEMFAKSEHLYANVSKFSMDDVNRTNANYIKEQTIEIMKDMTGAVFGKYEENTGKEPIEMVEMSKEETSKDEEPIEKKD